MLLFGRIIEFIKNAIDKRFGRFIIKIHALIRSRG
jgi:hypothetical protein